MNNTKENEEVKLLIPYIDLEDKPGIESVWAEKIGDNYRIVNIPFFAESLSYGDVVSVVVEPDGMLLFDEVVTPSGHSTVQLIIMDEVTTVAEVGEQLVELGCDWEGSHIPEYISIDIPADLSYKPIRAFLMSGEAEGKWDFREACLAHDY